MEVDARRLSGLKYKLEYSFKLSMDMIGVASGRLCMTQMNQNSWKENWWDLVCIGTGRSEFTILHVD